MSAQTHEWFFRGLYSVHLENWLKHVPRDQFLIIFNEELKATPGVAMRRYGYTLPPVCDHVP